MATPETSSASNVSAHPTADASMSSIARTLEIIGDRWSLLILRDVFRGMRRFSEIQTGLGIAKNLLADRLNKLVDAGVLEKVPYQDRPVRHEYCLTDKGRALSPALVALMHWGDEWCSDGEAPTVLVHDTCGSPIELELNCPTCHDMLSAKDLRSRPGEGQ